MLCSPLFSGRIELFKRSSSHQHAQIPLSASVQDVVILTIEDSPSAGGNLVSAMGIDFGDVNSLGTTQTPGVVGSLHNQRGHYEANFLLSVNRSGRGKLNLFARRASAGNFNARDGIEIENSHGVLSPLSAMQSQGTLVLHNVSPGSYERTIAINIYPQDKGRLRTVLEFTLCAL